MSPKKNVQAKKKKRRPKSLVLKNLRQIIQIAPFLFPIIVTAFTYSWLYTRTNIVAHPIEGLRSRKVNLMKRNDALHLSIEQLQAPQRIEAIAREKLGMISPERWQVVVLDKPVRAPEAAVQMAAPAPQEWRGLPGLFFRLSAGLPAAQASPQTTEQPG